MALTVAMPQLGESVTEGTIAKWLKQPGESVERYEALAEVVTDKVNAEIPAPAEGVMGRQLVAEGAVVPVGAPICELEGAATGAAATAAPATAAPATAAPTTAAPAAAQESGGEAEVAALHLVGEAQPPPAEVQAPTGAAREAAPAASSGAPATDPRPVHVGGAGNGEPLHVTPAVRMLAREHGVDLSSLQGSGIGGRVTKKDVLELVQRRGAAEAAPAAAGRPTPPATTAPPASTRPAAEPVAPSQLDGDTLVPLSQARRAIADHMVRSKQTSPHAYAMVEVDMTAVVRARQRHRAEFERLTGVHLTFLPFVARAAIAALRRHPTLNAVFTPDGIVLKRDVNLGIAVALEDMLIVPVIHGADRLNLAGLAQAARDLGERARAGRLRVDELQGGTFTLNNTGALGAVITVPIINQPQAAILTMDAIVKRPVVVAGDAIAVRSMMNLGLAFDHRVNDGLPATAYLNSVKQGLEGVDEEAGLV